MVMSHRVFFGALLIVFSCSCAGDMSFRKQADIPEEKIAALAEQVEELVLTAELEGTKVPENNAEWDPGEELEDFNPLSLVIDVDEIRERVPALAELNMDNEIVLSAIRGRILRREAVREMETKGCVGENRKALLQYLGSRWCPGDRYERNRASYIVLTENRDRRSIYNQIIEINELGSSSMETIREIFAEQIQRKAWATTPIQMSDGSWQRK